MAIKLEVIRSGVLPEKINQELKVFFTSVDSAIEQIAYATRDHMRQVIQAKTYRAGSTGNLMRSINAYSIEVGGWGIGDIQELDYSAPYWYLMNYGGMSTIAARGETIYGNFGGFKPDSAMKGSNPGAGPEKFIKGAGPVYRMTPRFPIMPKNYIEDTSNWLSTVFEVHFSTAMNRFKISSGLTPNYSFSGGASSVGTSQDL